MTGLGCDYGVKVMKYAKNDKNSRILRNFYTILRVYYYNIMCGGSGVSGAAEKDEGASIVKVTNNVWI